MNPGGTFGVNSSNSLLTCSIMLFIKCRCLKLKFVVPSCYTNVDINSDFKHTVSLIFSQPDISQEKPVQDSVFSAASAEVASTDVTKLLCSYCRCQVLKITLLYSYNTVWLVMDSFKNKWHSRNRDIIFFYFTHYFPLSKPGNSITHKCSWNQWLTRLMEVIDLPVNTL